MFSEFSTAVKCWDIFCENWEPRRQTALKLASTTQNCLENATVRILEYRTNVNGTVKWFFHEYFETTGRFFFTWLLMALQLIMTMTTCWQLPIRDNIFIKSFSLITLSRRNLFSHNLLQLKELNETYLGISVTKIWQNCRFWGILIP